MNIVNSWNEWDPLREVVVGSARGAADIGYEPALSPYFPRGSQGRDYRGGPVPAALVDDAERQLDHFAEILARRGITVRRPDPVEQYISVKTPDWEVAGGHATACPRDILLVVGNEIIEAPMAQRARYFEFRAYRSLLTDYFRHGARWTAAPKPLMRDELYIEREASEQEAGERDTEKRKTAKREVAERDAGDRELFDFNSTPLLAESEPVFDAACFTRCGRDIFWQPDLVSNQMGADWLGRHLGPGFRIHRIEFREPTPTHIDTTLVPVRQDRCWLTRSVRARNGGMQLFEKNGWRTVQAPALVRTGRSPARDVSNWISMNILMLDENTVVIEQAETPMIELMRSLGCEVITCPFDRVYPFGGGFHCCTADIRREGTLQSYFPALDAKSQRQD